jgi:hypothetical protein
MNLILFMDEILEIADDSSNRKNASDSVDGRYRSQRLSQFSLSDN